MAQIEASRHEELAFFSEKAPTLVELKFTYGDNFPAIWLMEQILDLVVYSNSRGTLNDYQARFLAESIATEYSHLKVSELLLFFYRFKMGRYGHFYAVVDPMKISIALEEFDKERHARHVERDKKAKNEKSEFVPGAVKPEEFCRKSGLPECHSALDVIRLREEIFSIIEAMLLLIGILYDYFTQDNTNTQKTCNNEKNHH